MITIKNISDIQYEKYDEIWFIVRSIKSLPNRPNVKQITELSPTKELFFKYRNLIKQEKWNKTTFDTIYVPQFLYDIKHNTLANQYLNKLWQLDKNGKNICLICFCRDETMCHRSIIAGLLQGAGCNVTTDTGNDYSHYFEQYKN